MAAQTSSERRSAEWLVRSLTLAIFLQWLGASAVLPLLPIYLRDRGGSDTGSGAVMAAYFVAALALQYPAGRLADRIGRRPVLIGGLLCYGAASVAFLLPVSPVGDIALRAAQGAGAGAAEVASLAMISAAVSIERRGRAFSSIYSGQLGGMAVGPLIGSLIGVSSMSIIFLVAGVMSVLACIPVLADADLAQHGARPEDRTARLRRRLSFNRAMTGSLLAAAALGLTIGVYESTWTLLLEHRQAATWQIGLSWTLFAIPFVAFSRVGGRLADRYDRRWLVFGALIVSVGFCCLYPFVTSVWWLLLLAPIESSGFAIALPSASPCSPSRRLRGRRAASRDSSPRPRQRPSPWRRQPAARCSGSTSGRPMCSRGQSVPCSPPPCRSCGDRSRGGYRVPRAATNGSVSTHAPPTSPTRHPEPGVRPARSPPAASCRP